MILYIFGSSAIKGFSITLTIGIVASMFSAILVTRVLFRWGSDLKILKNLTFLDLIKNPDYDFLGKARVCAMVSAALVLISLTGVLLFVAMVALSDKALGHWHESAQRTA